MAKENKNEESQWRRVDLLKPSQDVPRYDSAGIRLDYTYTPCFGTHGSRGNPIGRCPKCGQLVYEMANDLPALILELKMNPSYPTQDVPRHRFEKTLEESPWRGTVRAVIELDDPAWELLGYPKELRINVSPLKAP